MTAADSNEKLALGHPKAVTSLILGCVATTASTLVILGFLGWSPSSGGANRESLALALFALMVLAPAFGVGAVWSAVEARRAFRQSPERYSNQGQALAGLLLGVFSLGLFVLRLLAPLVR